MVKKGGKKAVSKADKRRWKIGSAIIIVSFTIVIGLLLWLSYTGSTKEIVAVADQFKPDPSWELKSEAIEPPRTFCGDVECPSVWRQWKTSKSFTQDEFLRIIEQTDWDLKLNHMCNFNSTRNTENMKICSAKGMVEDYVITLTVRSTGDGTSYLIGLSIWRE